MYGIIMMHLKKKNQNKKGMMYGIIMMHLKKKKKSEQEGYDVWHNYDASLKKKKNQNKKGMMYGIIMMHLKKKKKIRTRRVWCMA